MRIERASHTVFAATMVAVGILEVIKVDLTAGLVAKGISAIEVLIYFSAFVSVACGVGLLWTRTAAPAARVLFAYLLLWLLVFRLPPVLHGLTVDIYWSLCQTGVMLAAAWVLYAWFAADWDRGRLGFVTGEKGLRIARALYGFAIIPFGVAHFQFVEHTASRVPGWLPGHVAWVYFTGAAFMAAGIAVLIGVCARLATALSALQMGMFLLLVWLPAVATRSLNSFQWGEVLATWELAAAAWVVADSYRAITSFAADKPLVVASRLGNDFVRETGETGRF